MPPTVPVEVGAAHALFRRLPGCQSSPEQTIHAAVTVRPNMESPSRRQSAMQAVKDEFFHLEPCRYTHDVYRKSAKVFTVLKKERDDVLRRRRKITETPELPPEYCDSEFKDVNEKRLTYELAFTTLKYYNLLEDIIEECSLTLINPDLARYQGLLMVMLYDYQSRKFQQRKPINGEVLDDLCLEVEHTLNNSRTKINACFAKRRVKASAQTIDDLLPDTVRKSMTKKTKMPIYLWVNQIRTTIPAMVEHFQDEGYELVTRPPEALEPLQFRVDAHCQDVLVFSPHCSDSVFESRPVLAGELVRQDKSSCFAPLSVKELVTDDDDVMHINVGSGISTAHVASLLHRGKSHVWAFGGKSDAEVSKVRKNIDRLGAKNVKLVQNESFLETDPEDSRFKSIKVAMFTADCSKSALMDPVEFIVSEGEGDLKIGGEKEMSILRDLSEEVVNNVDRIGELMAEHAKTLRHIMKFPRVHAVVFMTRSVHEAENENVVTKAVEYVNMTQQRRMPFRLVPPVISFSGEDIEAGQGVDGKYIKFGPSPAMNGCFVAVVSREGWGAMAAIDHDHSSRSAPEDMKDAARDIIARATKKGLLGKTGDKGDGSGSTRKGRRTKKGNTSPQSSLKISSTVSPVMAYIKASPSPRRRSPGTSRADTNPSSDTHSTTTSSPSFPRSRLVPEHAKVIKHPAPFR